MLEFGVMFFSMADDGKAVSQYADILSCSRLADDLGLASVWVPERHYHEFGGLFPNPAILGAAIATCTDKIRICAGSVVSPLHNSISLVEDWSLVDNLSSGRTRISLASGWNPIDFGTVSEKFEDRREILEAQVEELRNYWAGNSLKIEMKGQDSVEIRAHPTPVQKEVPLLLTSSGRIETFEQAGRLGTGVLTHLLGQSVSDLREKIERYRASFNYSSTPTNSKESHVVVMVHTMLGHDHEQTVSRAFEYMCKYFNSSLDLELTARVSSQGLRRREEMIANRVQKHIDSKALVGSPARCKEIVEELAASGVDEIACLIDFGLNFREMQETIELVAEFHSGRECSK